jgi:hypothetical protein
MEIKTEQIEKIIQDSLPYPSGDNCQPFSFIWKDQRLEIYHDDKRGAHPLNPQNVASVLSLGSLIESISIASSQMGCEAQVQYHPYHLEPQQAWATIQFDQTLHPPDDLISFLSERTTDRRPFQKGEIPEFLLKKSNETRKKNSNIQLHINSNLSPELMDYLIKADTLMTQHNPILPKVIQWTRLTEAQAREHGDGLTLQNMGIKVWEIPSLIMIREFPASMNLLKGPITSQHKVRVREQLESAAGVLCVSIQKEAFSQVPDAGRLMFRSWVQLTKVGFGGQPMTIPSMMMYCAVQNILDGLIPDNWIEYYKSNLSLVRQAFEIPEDHLPIWMLRTGRSTPLPLALRTHRRPVQKVLKIG